MDAKANIAMGALFFVGGIIITIVTFSAAAGGGTYVVAWGAIVFGLIQLVRGLAALPGSSGNEEEPYAAAGGGPANSARLVSGGFSIDDYPSRALREEIEGRTVVGFTVDETGTVRDAYVAESSGNESLDQTACRIIRERFRYQSALDSEGRPIAEDRTQPVVWALE